MELRIRRLRTDGRDSQCSLERVMLIRKPLQAKIGAVHYDDYSDHDGALSLMDMVSGNLSFSLFLGILGHATPQHRLTRYILGKEEVVKTISGVSPTSQYLTLLPLPPCPTQPKHSTERSAAPSISFPRSGDALLTTVRPLTEVPSSTATASAH